MSFNDLLNSTGSVASIIGGGILTIVGSSFAVGRWWRGRELSSEARRKALVDVCAAITQTKLVSVQVDGDTYGRGQGIPIQYWVSSTADIELGIWLGASLWSEGPKQEMYNAPTEDKSISVLKGTHLYERSLTVPVRTPPGVYNLNVNVWFGDPAQAISSHLIHSVRPLKKVRIN